MTEGEGEAPRESVAVGVEVGLGVKEGVGEGEGANRAQDMVTLPAAPFTPRAAPPAAPVA